MSQQGQNPISQEQIDALDAAPQVSESFPIQLEGGFRIEEFFAQCASCNRDLDDTRGSVIKHSPAMVELNATGICPECRLATPVRARFIQKAGEKAQVNWLKGRQWISMPVDSLSPAPWWASLASLFQEIFHKPR